jgi:hypothetical protein
MIRNSGGRWVLTAQYLLPSEYAVSKRDWFTHLEKPPLDRTFNRSLHRYPLRARCARTRHLKWDNSAVAGHDMMLSP